jgi:putative ABC transport system permease protein
MKAGINYLTMAFRNLGRHRTKTIITVLAIAIGIGAYIFVDALLVGMNLDSRRNLVNYETGAVKIYSKAYLKDKDDMPLYESFGNYRPIADKLESAGYSVVPHAVFNGSLISADQEYPFKFIGIDTEKEPKVLKYGNYMEKDGSRFLDGNKFEIILGEKGATDLNVGVPKIMDQDDFENDILGKITDDNDRDFIIKCYDKKDIPEKIDSVVFKKNVLGKLKESGDRNLVKGFYKDDLYYFDLKKTPKSGDVEKLTALFDKINFTYAKKYKLKDDLNADDKSRIWNILTGIGRNTVRLSTVIDKKDADGNIKHINQLMELTVIGVVNSPNPITNGYVAYLPLGILQDEMGLLLDGNITELSVRKAASRDDVLPSKAESPEAIKRILGDTLPANLTVVGWQEDARDYLAVSGADNVQNRILILFFLFIAVIGIANTMLMAVLERTKEVGMLRALGMNDSKIVILFVIESGMIGFIGALFGILLGILINIYMVGHGIDYSGLMEKTNINNFGYRIVGIYKSAWNFTSMFFSLILGTIVSAIMAYFPSLKAIKISIIDALRFE